MGSFTKPLYRFETNEKIVALTFDDGPAKQWTPLLLDLLKRHSVKATFFVVGQRVERNKEIVKREFREGHVIGNHSYQHDTKIFRPYSFTKNEVEKVDNLLLSLGIPKTSFYRPPTGMKMFMIPLVIKNMEKVLVMWDVHPPTEQFITKRLNGDKKFLSQYVIDISQYVIDHSRPGSIILLHDGWWGNQEPMMRALEQIIVELKRRGFRFVTIQEGLDISKRQSH